MALWYSGTGTEGASHESKRQTHSTDLSCSPCDFTFLCTLVVLLRSNKIMFVCFCLLVLSRFALGKLVVNIEDLDALDVNALEKEATIIETFVRETDCDGVTVLSYISHFVYINAYIRRMSGCLNILSLITVKKSKKLLRLCPNLSMSQKALFTVKMRAGYNPQ